MYWGEGPGGKGSHQCARIGCFMHVTGSQASSTSFVQCKRQFGRIDVSSKLTQKVRSIWRHIRYPRGGFTIKEGCCTTRAPGADLTLLMGLRRRRTAAVKTESLEDSDLDDEWDDEELARLRVRDATCTADCLCYHMPQTRRQSKSHWCTL